MNRDPLLLIAEYLKHRDARIRRNAAVAAAVVGNEPAVDALLTLASDEDASVRLQAETELAALQGTSATLRNETLSRRLAAPTRQERHDAHALLGRLNLDTLDVPPPRSFLSRVADVATLRSLPDPARGRVFDWKTVLVGLGGGLAGGFLLVLYLSVSPGAQMPSKFFSFLVLVPPLVAIVLTLVATVRSLPFSLQYDRRAAVVAELVPAGILTFVTVFVVVLVLLTTQFEAPPRDIVKLSALCAGAIAAFVMIIRAGVMIAVMAWNPGTELLVAWGGIGAAAGFLFLTGCLVLFRRLAPAAAGVVLARSAALLIEGTWLIALPAALGIAWAYARIDRSPRVRRRTSGSARIVSLAMVSAAAAVIVYASPLMTLPRNPPPPSVPVAASGMDLEQSVAVTAVPTSLPFAAAFGQTIEARVTVPPDSELDPLTNTAFRADLALRLYGWEPEKESAGQPQCNDLPPSRRILRTADDPESIEVSLAWGCYLLEVATVDPESSRLYLDSQTFGRAVTSALEARVPKVAAARAEEQYGLRLVLNRQRDRRFEFDRLSPISNGSWVITEPSSTRTFALAEPRDVSLQLGNPGTILRVPRNEEEFDRFRLRDRRREIDPPPPSSNDAVIELSQGGRNIGQGDSIEKSLKAGEYTVTVRSKGQQQSRSQQQGDRRRTRTLLVAARAGLEEFSDGDKPAASTGSTRSGYWPIQDLPKRFTFRVEFPQPIEATVESGPSPTDYVLELRRNGRLIEDADDPERIRRTLDPGEYTLVVREYLSARPTSRAQPTGARLNLTLNPQAGRSSTP